MRRKVLIMLAASLLALATITPSLAGYEGQPGNQSANQGGGNNGNGPSGYEGQPGGQGGG